MRKIILTLTTIFICAATFARTINWHVGDTLLQTTTCESGNSITPPTAPDKYGYHFVKWEEQYTQIEYLESTGTQYIDTGVIPNQNIKIITLVTPKNIDENGIAGNVWAARSPLLIFYQNKVRWHLVHSGSIDSNTITNDTPIYIEASNGFLQVNTSTYHSSKISSYSTTSTLNIFFRGNTSKISKIKIHYFQIYDNNILVRDFIPVLDKDGTPCLYDKVENKFYYNQGTGDFIAGPVSTE